MLCPNTLYSQFYRDSCTQEYLSLIVVITLCSKMSNEMWEIHILDAFFVLLTDLTLV